MTTVAFITLIEPASAAAFIASRAVTRGVVRSCWLCAGLPELKTPADLNYMRRVFVLEQTEVEAAKASMRPAFRRKPPRRQAGRSHTR